MCPHINLCLMHVSLLTCGEIIISQKKNVRASNCLGDINSRVIRKAAFCICENKGADQLRGNCEADQRLCFRYIDSTFPLHFNPLAIFCGCTARFVLDLVGNLEDRFFSVAAHIIIIVGMIDAYFCPEIPVREWFNVFKGDQSYLGIKRKPVVRVYDQV